MMKVTCNHCGASNDLGRIFCMACGKRMTITAEDVNQAQVKQGAFKWLGVIRPIVVLLVFVVAALMIWPRVPAGPATQTNQAALRAKLGVKVGALHVAAGSKRESNASFDAEELNVYVKARVPDGAAADTLTISLEPDRIVVLEQAKLGPFKVGGKSVGPLRFTRQIICRPAGRIFEITGASIGHLPMPGPLKNLVSKPLLKYLALTQSEQTIEKQLTGISIQDGKLEIKVGP